MAIPQNGFTSYEDRGTSLFVSSFLRFLIWYARFFGFAIHAIPQNGLTTYGAHQYFRVVVLALPCTVCKPFRVHNSSNLSKWIDMSWGPTSFLMLSFLCCLIRYAILLGFAIYPIPQNGWTSYEAYPSFRRHHSGTALYGTQALLASEFLGNLIRNPSILRHHARVHKPYSHSEGF